MIDPSSAGISPSSVRASVVLPLPDSPTSPSVSPGRSSKLRSSTARMSLPSWRNVLCRLSARITGSAFWSTGLNAAEAGVARGSSCACSQKWQRLWRPFARSWNGGSSFEQISCASPQRSTNTQAGRSCAELRQEAGDRVQPLLVLAHAAARQAAQQADRVGVPRVVEHVVDRALLDEPPGVQHADALAHLRDHLEVVADEEDARVELLAQHRDEVEHLRLDRRVQPGGRLVEDQQRGVLGQRHRDHDALLHAARELVRVAAHDAVGVGDLDLARAFPWPARAPAWDPRRRSRTPRPPGRRSGSSGSAPRRGSGRPSRPCWRAACAPAPRSGPPGPPRPRARSRSRCARCAAGSAGRHRPRSTCRSPTRPPARRTRHGDRERDAAQDGPPDPAHAVGDLEVGELESGRGGDGAVGGRGHRSKAEATPSAIRFTPMTSVAIARLGNRTGHQKPPEITP